MNIENPKKPHPISQFSPIKCQTILSCKRKATRILQRLKKHNKNPKVGLLIDTLCFDSEISYIFCPYQYDQYLSKHFLFYTQKKEIDKQTTVTRGLLLDFLAYHDGYKSWESFQHYQKQELITNKTFLFSHDFEFVKTLQGSGRVYECKSNDVKLDVSLFNPSDDPIEFKRGYSWGYRGTGVRECAKALLYAINQPTFLYKQVVALLSHFIRDSKLELILTQREISEFIDYTNAKFVDARTGYFDIDAIAKPREIQEYTIKDFFKYPIKTSFSTTK